MKKFNLSEGLTLVELLIVIAIMAAVIGLASKSINLITQARVGIVRDVILKMIEEARFRSLTSVPHGVRCDGTMVQLLAVRDGTCSHDNSLRCINDEDCGIGNICISGDYRFSISEETITRENYQIPYGYRICCLTSCNTYTIWFDRKGIPRDVSWGLGMTTIRILDGSQTMADIPISAAGRVKYEK
ncbi:MAG: type II secretion system GspH family protein [Syntrophobacterales bacterium]|nr:type II secretion system GspH family protein [Syntrophobacterales bacterium]